MPTSIWACERTSFWVNLPLRDSSRCRRRAPGAHNSVYGLTVDPIINIPVTRKYSGYVLIGPDFFHRGGKLDSSTAIPGSPCNAFWVWWGVCSNTSIPLSGRFSIPARMSLASISVAALRARYAEISKCMARYGICTRRTTTSAPTCGRLRLGFGGRLARINTDFHGFWERAPRSSATPDWCDNSRGLHSASAVARTKTRLWAVRRLCLHSPRAVRLRRCNAPAPASTRDRWRSHPA